MGEALDKVTICSVCGNIDTFDPCTICTDGSRDQSIVIVVEDVSDLWALERAKALNAAYHVLGGVLSPLDGIGRILRHTVSAEPFGDGGPSAAELGNFV